MPGGTSIFFSGTSLFKLPGAFRSRVGAIHEASEESTDRSKATSLTPSETSTLPRPCDLRPYAVPDATQAPKPGSSHVFRANLVSEGPLAGSEPTVAVKTCWDNFARAVKENGDRPFLGTRVRNPDGTLGSTYEFKTYHETYITVIRISNGLAHLGVKKGSNVGIYAVNRAEWTVSEYGVYNNSAVVVPLYDTLGKEATAYILDATEMEICVASADRVKSLLQHRNNRSAKHLKTIICMDKKVDSQLQSDCSAAGLKLYSFDELEELGMKHPRSDDEIELPTFDTVASIVWTSGTTGMPKGVVTTHGAIMAFPNAAGLMGTAGSFISFSSEDIYCSYLPLAHVFERGVFAVMIHNSARIAFYSGDVTKLLEDIALVRPTIFVSVPRLLNRIYAKMTTALASKPWFIRKLFDLAYAAKQAQIDAGGPPSHWILDNTIFRGARNLLGGQVRAIISGAAPISGQVMGFLRVVFGCDVLEGYGQSECMCIAATMLGDTAPGALGPPYPAVEVQLVAVPELGYSPEDLPFPRGEVCARGPIAFKEYYKDPERTRETMDEDGWVRTGDVGRIDADGRLAIIDRKKNFFKLSQGEYCAPEKIENVFMRNPLVAQICLLGDSTKSKPVAIVVPTDDVFIPWATNKCGISGTSAELCADAVVRSAFCDELSAFGRANGLAGFELPGEIHLDTEMWTVENGLITPTFKVKRHEVKEKYLDALEQMYARIDQ